MSILVTGSTGFVGYHLVERLKNEDKDVFCAMRGSPSSNTSIMIPDINGDTDWSHCFESVGSVIHLAARAHIMDDGVNDPLAEYRRVNAEGTLNLARQAAANGVRRFIFLSSIKVNGEQTEPGKPFKETDIPQPEDAYGLSKMEAEQGLLKISQETGLEVVIIRSPLIYGSGVKGNFRSLMSWVGRGVPLPFGSFDNKRSLVGVGNLTDLLVRCIDHPAAANEVFFVSDGEDLSTTDLLKKVGRAIRRPARLIPVPSGWLAFAAKCAGKTQLSQRLCGNLQVDISKVRTLLGWNPPFSIDEGLRQAAEGFFDKRAPKPPLLVRFFDLLFSSVGLFICMPVLTVIYMIGLFDTGAPLFFQQRVGRNKKTFTLVKFRTMKVDTASVASHLASVSSITRFGHFLRRSKIDELPQLWNVLKGEMSLVGPRPCLLSQKELIEERTARGVYDVRPGVTGLAQVSGIDMSTPKLLAETDKKMIETLTLSAYFSYIIQTATGKGAGDRVVK